MVHLLLRIKLWYNIFAAKPTPRQQWEVRLMLLGFLGTVAVGVLINLISNYIYDKLNGRK